MASAGQSTPRSRGLPLHADAGLPGLEGHDSVLGWLAQLHLHHVVSQLTRLIRERVQVRELGRAGNVIDGLGVRRSLGREHTRMTPRRIRAP